MSLYVAEVFGWMTVIEAKTKREALSVAKARAPMASLQSADVGAGSVRQANEGDLAWYRDMSGKAGASA